MDSQRNILEHSRLDISTLYRKYDSEVRLLARKLRAIFHRMESSGYRSGISDIEGELLYMLVRETRADSVFEISPDCGWSTNYLMAGITANGCGVLHSFEIEPLKNGKPTETVVRSNLHPDWDQTRLLLHIGDAQTTVPSVRGKAGFLFIDSCHEDWFAEWYIKEVFPRVTGLAFLQDISFIDELEPSSEAKYVWDWAKHEGLTLTLVGALEDELRSSGVRAGYAERRNVRSNSIVLRMPKPTYGNLPALAQSPARLLDFADALAENGQCLEADETVTSAVAIILRDIERTNRHRLLIKAGRIYQRIGEMHEARRAFRRALGVAVLANTPQAKGLSELTNLFAVSRQWGLLVQASFLTMFTTPHGGRLMLRRLPALIRALIRKVVQ